MKRSNLKRLLFEPWKDVLPNVAALIIPSGKVILPRLPALISFMLLALGAGWIGGRWAAQFELQGTTVSLPPAISSNREQAVVLTQDNSLHQPEATAEGKAYLGIRGKEFQTQEVQGVKIMEVFPDSPAARAGLRADHDPVPAYLRQPGRTTGHVIIGANGQLLRSEEDLARLLALSTPGTLMELLVSSTDGVAYEVIPVTLGTAPERPPDVETRTVEDTQDSSTLQRATEKEVHG